MNVTRQQSLKALFQAPTLLIVLTIVALLLALFAVLSFPYRAHADTGMLLDVGQRIVDGHLPYVDFEEINLPTILFMNALVVGLSHLLNTNAILIYHLVTWLTLVYCVAISYWIIQKLMPVRVAFYTALIPLTMVLLSILFISTLFFGEREYLIILLFLVWFFLRWLRWNGGEFPAFAAYGVGFLACLASSIKPYYIPMFLVPDLYWVIVKGYSRRMFSRAEFAGTLTFMLLTVGYGVAYPAVIDAYVNKVMPSAISGYRAWGQVSLYRLIIQYGHWSDYAMMILPFVVPLFYRRLNKSQFWRLAQCLSIVGFFALMGYAVQGKGWFYHRIPFFVSWYLMLVLMMIAILIELRRINGVLLSFTFTIFLSALTFSLANNAMAAGAENPLGHGSAAFNRIVEQYTQVGDKVLALDTVPFKIYPGLAQTGRRQALSHYTEGYPIAFAYVDFTSEAIFSPDHVLPPVVQEYIDILENDIVSQKPPLLMIKVGQCDACPVGFGIFEFLDYIGFVDRVIVPQYDYVTTSDGLRVYLLRNK